MNFISAFNKIDEFHKTVHPNKLDQQLAMNSTKALRIVQANKCFLVTNN